MGSLALQVASDLHLEFRGGDGKWQPPAESFRPLAGRDLLVLAGDIGVGDVALPFIERELRRSPVVYVPGNHEYYRRSLRQSIDAEWKAAAASRPGLTYLTGEAVEVDGVRIWGGPWYSDLWGVDPRSKAGERAYYVISTCICDFSTEFSWGSPWTLSRHVKSHCEQTEGLRQHAGEVDVVITHWPPSAGAIHPRFRGDELTPYFVNKRPDVVAEIGAKLWVSGHTHEAYDYREGVTRCVGNPSGYPREEILSRLFAPDRSVEIDV